MTTRRNAAHGEGGALDDDQCKIASSATASDETHEPEPHLDEIGSKYPVRDIAVEMIGADKPERLRQLRPAKVDEIAESMADVGLINPITVRSGLGGGYTLLSGLHRLLAAKKLKWPSIQCKVRDDLDAMRAELVEIDENLRRADLTSEERATHLHIRKELWGKRQGVVAHDAPKPRSGPKGGRPKGFASETAAETGMSKSQINRLLAGKTEPKPTAKPIAEQRRALIAAWEEASPEVREWIAVAVVAETKPKRSRAAGVGMAGLIGRFCTRLCQNSTPETAAEEVMREPDSAREFLEGDVRTIHQWLDAFMVAVKLVEIEPDGTEP